jgi:hypothetical protein
MKAFIWIDRFKRRCELDTNPGVGDNQIFCLPREVDIGQTRVTQPLLTAVVFVSINLSASSMGSPRNFTA